MAEIAQIGSLSAHADREDLLWWLVKIEQAPKQVFLNHGESAAAEALQAKIKTLKKWPVTIAELNQIYNL